MNNNAFYQRRHDRATMPAPQTPQPHTQEEVAALAVHGDPSVPTTAAATADPKPERGIAWVRPSELPTVLGSTWAPRGIDLQSELVRRSRRAPIQAARAGRRISRTSRAAIAHPEPITPTVTSTSAQEPRL